MHNPLDPAADLVNRTFQSVKSRGLEQTVWPRLRMLSETFPTPPQTSTKSKSNNGDRSGEKGKQREVVGGSAARSSFSSPISVRIALKPFSSLV